VADGHDTNLSGDDFWVSPPTPGAPNATPPPPPDCTAGDVVTINEFTAVTGSEFVELYNAGSVAADIGRWQLEWGTSSYSYSWEVPDGTTLGAGEFFVVGSAGASYKDVEQDLSSFGNASSNADSIRITCDGGVVDTVVYTKDGDPSDNTDAWVDDSGQVATSLAPLPGSGESAGRVQDGYDTDLSGSDFAVGTPSPGEPNPEVVPPVCETDGGDFVRINEFLYAVAGSGDATKQWVELTNTGTAPFRIDGWTIEAGKSDWAVDFTFPGGTEIAPGEYILVAGTDVEDPTFVAEDMSLGSGSGGDGLRIVDCEGRVIDTVLYGDTMEDGLLGDNGTGDVVADADDDLSLGRYPNGVDTNDPSDWHAYLTPTPGAANTDPSDPGNKTDDPGGGCNGTSHPGGGMAGSCSTVLPLGGWESALLALALIRRRK
jgi:hypothetical protein